MDDVLRMVPTSRIISVRLPLFRHLDRMIESCKGGLRDLLAAIAANPRFHLGLRRSGCNLIAPELVDEWLQARNALSIEIFAGTPASVAHPVVCALKASFTASSGGIEPSRSSVRHCSLRGYGE
jgi:hypothetical protein